MAGAAVPTPRFLADVYEAASECNKCSLCQATCPAYVVNPVEWETARGRIALIRDAIEGKLELQRHRRRSALDLPHLRQLRRRLRAASADRAHRQPRAPGAARAGGLSLGSVVRAAQRAARGPGALRALHGFARFTQRTGLYWPGAAHRAAVVARHRRARLPSRAVRRPTAPSTRCSATCPRPPSRCAGPSRCWSAASRISPSRSRPRRRSACCSRPGYAVEVPVIGCSGLPARTLGDRDAMVDMAVRNSAAMSATRCRRVHRRHGLVHRALPRVRQHRR